MSIRTEMLAIPVGQDVFQGFFAAPEGGPHPGIVVIQEVFGINDHIQNVTQRLAEAGYTCIAPDLFWRAQPGFTSGYSPEEIETAIAMRQRIDDSQAAEDIRAAMQVLISRPESRGIKTGVVGFCWGGLMTYLSAARLAPACAVSYYGGGIVNHIDEFAKIKIPIMFHFGEQDSSIPMDQVEQVRQAAAGSALATVHTYADTGHGFNCDMRPDFHPASASLAWERTLGFFRNHLP